MATVETSTDQSTESFVEPDFLFEIVDGQIVEALPMGNSAINYANYLACLLNQTALPQKIGFAFVEAIFRPKPDGNARRPDVAFVRTDVYDLFANLDDSASVFEFAPNIAIEVISPTNTASEIEIKVQEYFEHGVELVWVIYPEQRRIHVFDTPDQARILNESDELDGGDVFPEFRLPLRTLFSTKAS